MYEDAHLDAMYEERFHVEDDFDHGLGEVGPTAEERDEMLDECEMEEAILQAEMQAEAALAQYDDDPNPYHGDYSEC